MSGAISSMSPISPRAAAKAFSPYPICGHSRYPRARHSSVHPMGSQQRMEATARGIRVSQSRRSCRRSSIACHAGAYPPPAAAPRTAAPSETAGSSRRRRPCVGLRTLRVLATSGGRDQTALPRRRSTSCTCLLRCALLTHNNWIAAPAGDGGRRCRKLPGRYARAYM